MGDVRSHVKPYWRLMGWLLVLPVSLLLTILCVGLPLLVLDQGMGVPVPRELALTSLILGEVLFLVLFARAMKRERQVYSWSIDGTASPLT